MTRINQMKNPKAVPTKMLKIFEELTSLTNNFCSQYLNDEYAEMARKIAAALCRKRISPIQSGNLQTWAAGIIHSICTINFGFDRSQQPSINSKEISAHFGRAQSTISSKSKEVRQLLKMNQWDHNWLLPSRVIDSPMVWLISLNGFIVDARRLPRHIQEEAVEKGIIPYVPQS